MQLIFTLCNIYIKCKIKHNTILYVLYIKDPSVHKIRMPIFKTENSLFLFQMNIDIFSCFFAFVMRIGHIDDSFGDEFLLWNSAPNLNSTFLRHKFDHVSSVQKPFSGF